MIRWFSIIRIVNRLHTPACRIAEIRNVDGNHFVCCGSEKSVIMPDELMLN
jgi:hypothetical protein